MKRIALLAVLLAPLAACAPGSRRGEAARAESAPAAEGGERLCRPLLPGPDWEERPPHACSNRLWEVPAAIVLYPLLVGVGLGLVTAPIWVPLILL
jgi:hypothetical protein